MAVRSTWCKRFLYMRMLYIRVVLCVAVFFAVVLLWVTHLGLLDVGPSLMSSRPGVDFSSLFSLDLPEPRCHPGLGLLILVTSHPGHRVSRSAIRKTWALQKKGSPYPWQVLFLVGLPLDVELDWNIHNEHKIHSDILLGNYVDSYRNLTLKVMHGMKWAVERCQPAHILKTDDDCYINTLRLPSLLREHGPSSRLYVGSIFPEDKRMVIRDPSSKWYVSHHDYEPDMYPPYASGVGYILSLDAAKILLRTARRIAPLPVEDAYVGILANAAHIRPRSSARFAKHNAKWSICNYRYLMVIHGLSPEHQAWAHKNALSTRTTCTRSIEVTYWR